MRGFTPDTTHLDSLRMLHAIELAFVLMAIGAIIINAVH